MQPACGGIVTAVSGRDAGPEPGDGARSQADAAGGSDGSLASDGPGRVDTGSPIDASATDGGASAEVGPRCATGANVFALTFAQYPALKNVGASVNVTATGYSDPVCGQGNIIVFQKSPGTYVAFSSSCTHSCCILGYTGSELLCPCDGATFDLTGATTSGRTSVNLAALAVCSDDNGVYVSW